MSDIRQREWECESVPNGSLGQLHGDCAFLYCDGRRIGHFHDRNIAEYVTASHNKRLYRRRPDGDDVGAEI